MREACAERLDLPRVFAADRRQRDAAGHEHGGQILHAGERHHHCGQSLVAGRHAEHARAHGQRTNQSAEDDGGVVAVGQTVEHALGALRAAVARIGDEAGEGHAAKPLDLPRRRLDEQSEFPVTGVIAERDGFAIGRAHAALRAEDEERLAPRLRRVPAHAGVLRQPEEIAAGTVAQHLLGQWQLARRAGGLAADAVDVFVRGGEQFEAHRMRGTWEVKRET